MSSAVAADARPGFLPVRARCRIGATPTWWLGMGWCGGEEGRETGREGSTRSRPRAFAAGGRGERAGSAGAARRRRTTRPLSPARAPRPRRRGGKPPPGRAAPRRRGASTLQPERSRRAAPSVPLVRPRRAGYGHPGKRGIGRTSWAGHPSGVAPRRSARPPRSARTTSSAGPPGAARAGVPRRRRPVALRATCSRGSTSPAPAAWRRQYDAINRFERTLVERGTRVLKARRCPSPGGAGAERAGRAARPTRRTGVRPGGRRPRLRRDDYQAAYAASPNGARRRAPSHVVPATASGTHVGGEPLLLDALRTCLRSVR